MPQPKAGRRSAKKEAKAQASAPEPVKPPKEKHKKHATELAHATHGRIRLKIPAAKNDPALLDKVREAFQKIPGIQAIEARHHSNSVVIFYDSKHHPDPSSLFASLMAIESSPIGNEQPVQARRAPKTELDEITGAIEEEAEFLADHSHVARSVVDAVKKLDREIKRATGSNVDLKILTPIVLAGVTFIEIGAAAATPMWITLVIFSLNHFVELRAHNVAEAATTRGRQGS